MTTSDYIDKMRAMSAYSCYQTNPRISLSNHFKPIYCMNGFPIEFETVNSTAKAEYQQRNRKKNPGSSYYIDPILDNFPLSLEEDEKHEQTTNNVKPCDLFAELLHKTSELVLRLISQEGYDASDIMVVNYQQLGFTCKDLNSNIHSLFEKQAWKIPEAQGLGEFLTSTKNKIMFPYYDTFTDCPAMLKGLDTKVLILCLGDNVDFEKLETVFDLYILFTRVVLN